MPTDKHSHGQKTEHPARKLASKSSFSKPVLLVFCLIFAAVGAYILLKSFAAPPPPTVYITPSSQILAGSTNFSVQVRENSGTATCVAPPANSPSACVNAVQANLSYDSNLLTFVNIDYTGSAFGLQAESSGGAGIIKIGRGVSGGNAPVSGDQLIATINFTTKTTTGNAAVAFSTGTALISAASNTDLLGSLAATAGGTFAIDTTAPTASVTAPTNNSTIAQGSTVNVTAVATDIGSSVSKVEIYIDGTLATTDLTSPYTYSWNTTGLPLGSHTVQAKSFDTVNNVANSSLNTVTLADQTAPVAPGTFRTTGTTSSSITLAWNASTDNIGVASYKLSRNGTLIATLTAATLSYNDTGLNVATVYNYSIIALDAAGNVSSASTLSPSTSAAIPGDTNNDGRVNVTDLSVLLTNYGGATATCDFNKDGVVNIIDLSILLSHYGT